MLRYPDLSRQGQTPIAARSSFGAILLHPRAELPARQGSRRMCRNTFCPCLTTASHPGPQPGNGGFDSPQGRGSEPKVLRYPDLGSQGRKPIAAHSLFGTNLFTRARGAAGAPHDSRGPNDLDHRNYNGPKVANSGDRASEAAGCLAKASATAHRVPTARRIGASRRWPAGKSVGFGWCRQRRCSGHFEVTTCPCFSDSRDRYHRPRDGTQRYERCRRRRDSFRWC